MEKRILLFAVIVLVAMFFMNVNYHGRAIEEVREEELKPEEYNPQMIDMSFSNQQNIIPSPPIIDFTSTCGDGIADLSLGEQCDCPDPSNCDMGNCVPGTTCIPPGFPDQCTCPLPLVNSNWPTVGDFDNDGDKDIVIGMWNSYFPFSFVEYDWLLSNNGAGNFNIAILSYLPLDSSYSLDSADLNNDGKLDIVVGNYMDVSYCGQPDIIYINNGNANFQVQLLPPDMETAGDVEVGDLDNDGDIDILAANIPSSCGLGSSRLYINQGPANFYDGTNGPVTFLPFVSLDRVELSDLDGDNDLDIAGVRSLWNPGYVPPNADVRIYINNGQGFFTEINTFPIQVEDYALFDIKVADLDNDGDNDIVLPVHLPYIGFVILENNGNAIFSLYNPLPVGIGIGAMTADTGDLDNDGDIDVILGRAGSSPKVLMNTGNLNFVSLDSLGGWSTIFQPPYLGGGLYPTLDDLNNDGKLDVIFTRTGVLSEPFRIYLHN